MKRLHLAIATNDISASIEEYSSLFECGPCVVIPDAYALWRTASVNFSVRRDESATPGELRHLGWEDSEARTFTTYKDINGIVWEQRPSASRGDRCDLAGLQICAEVKLGGCALKSRPDGRLFTRHRAVFR